MVVTFDTSDTIAGAFMYAPSGIGFAGFLYNLHFVPVVSCFDFIHTSITFLLFSFFVNCQVVSEVTGCPPSCTDTYLESTTVTVMESAKTIEQIDSGIASLGLYFEDTVYNVQVPMFVRMYIIYNAYNIFIAN